jgi:hypothetical protein
MPFVTGVVGTCAYPNLRKVTEGLAWLHLGFGKLIIPLLFLGVMIAGALLGRPGRILVPSKWMETAVGETPFLQFLCRSFRGFHVFATSPSAILQGLLGSGHGQGACFGSAAFQSGIDAATAGDKTVFGLKKTAVLLA